MTVLSALGSALGWYVTLSLIACLAYPLVFHGCARLPDRGLSLARPLGLLLAVVPLWIAGQLVSVPFTNVSLFLVVLTVGALAWSIDLRCPEIVQFIKARWRRAALIEFVTLTLFLAYALVRGFNPDARGTEKPMELAILAASINSNSIQVNDPWFSGESINYYFMGYVAIAAVAKLAATSVGLAFTLGLATIFALATVAAAGTTANFTESFVARGRLPVLASAVLGGYLLTFAGNLFAVRSLLDDPLSTLMDSWWAGVGWRSSRVIEDGGFSGYSVRTVITEFPAFSFVLGDLHPHVLAYPWLISAVAVNLGLAISVRTNSSWIKLLPPATLAGVLVGALYATNSWDVPIVMLLTMLAIVVSWGYTSWKRLAVAGCATGLLGFFTGFPFALRYTPATGDPTIQPGGIVSVVPFAETIARNVGVVWWDRSSLQELATAHGAFYVCLIAVLLVSWLGTVGRERPPALQILVAVATILVAAVVTRAPAVALFGPPLLMVLFLAWRSQRDVARQFALGASGAALTLIIAVEFFFVRDAFGDRMNTVFKIYFQVWAMLAVVIPPLLAGAYYRMRRSMTRSLQLAVGIPVGLILIATTVYAPISVYRWNGEFRQWRGIDATSFLERERPAEAAITAWIERNTDPDTRILEAPGCSYGSDRGIPHNRVSMMTGRATLIGWTGHEFQWRRGQPEQVGQIGLRVTHANAIYEPERADEAGQLLDLYRIDYIIVGDLELIGYAQCDHGPPYQQDGISAIEQLGWTIVFERDAARIYARPPD